MLNCTLNLPCVGTIQVHVYPSLQTISTLMTCVISVKVFTTTNSDCRGVSTSNLRKGESFCKVLSELTLKKRRRSTLHFNITRLLDSVSGLPQKTFGVGRVPFTSGFVFRRQDPGPTTTTFYSRHTHYGKKKKRKCGYASHPSGKEEKVLGLQFSRIDLLLELLEPYSENTRCR